MPDISRRFKFRKRGADAFFAFAAFSHDMRDGKIPFVGKTQHIRQKPSGFERQFLFAERGIAYLSEIFCLFCAYNGHLCFFLSFHFRENGARATVSLIK